jgi:hypothetical protein
MVQEELRLLEFAGGIEVSPRPDIHVKVIAYFYFCALFANRMKLNNN